MIDISSLEVFLINMLNNYKHSANRQTLAKICLGVNAVIQHEDFDQIADKHCSYYRMQNYWLWRYQNNKV